MKIIEALPKTKYSAALKHSTTPEFQALKKKSIARVQTMHNDPRVNQDEPVVLMFGGGKDSLACSILCADANLPVEHISVNTGGDVYRHEEIFPEWREFYIKKYNQEPDHFVYQTRKKYPYIIKDYFDWAHKYGYTNVNFWDWGIMEASIGWEITGKFAQEEMGNRDCPMVVWGSRRGEGQERAFQQARLGLFQEIKYVDSKEENAIIRALPIGEWKDIDVWAYLIESDAPISPIYSFNEIPQKIGNRAFPRTLWYCASNIFSAQLYRWLAKYSPSQLEELCSLFPEIQQRILTNDKK